MVNEGKVRTMTKLAFYENKEGKKYLPVSKYYRSDYIGLALIKNFFLISIAYVLVLVLLGTYYLDYLLDNINQINWVNLGIALLVGYLVLLGAYSLLVYILYSFRYNKAKKSVSEYYTDLGDIAGIYVEHDAKRISDGRGRSRRKK